MRHMSLKKSFIYLFFFLFQKCNKFVCGRQKHTLTPYRSWRQGQGKMPILFSLLRLQISCSFGTFPKTAHQLTIGANRRIVIAKTKVRPYNDGSVSMLVGSKSGVSNVSSVSRGTCFDWLSHQGPPISGTRYTHHCIACFALPGCIMDKILLNIYKIYHL